MEKERKCIAPNECSLGRWIGTLALSLFVGIVLVAPLYLFLNVPDKYFMGISYVSIFSVVAFVPMFIALVLFIRLIAKTSLKDFVLGVGGTVHRKSSLAFLGLYVLGFALTHLIVINKLSVRGVEGDTFAFLLVLTVLTVWTQTTFEELIFRGILIRWACKNKLGYTKRALIAATVSSIAFALAHIANPEVTTQSGINIVIAVITYAIPGFIYFIADLHFGSLLPGIIMHWLNNLLLFTVVSSEVTVVSFPTLLIDHSGDGAVWGLVTTVLVHLPAIIYILVSKRKSK